MVQDNYRGQIVHDPSEMCMSPSVSTLVFIYINK